MSIVDMFGFGVGFCLFLFFVAILIAFVYSLITTLLVSKNTDSRVSREVYKVRKDVK